jgi:2-polyprenyl-3-methyl-5-hydroxy-6-metoxy-1,4-benzoquinol methylase
MIRTEACTRCPICGAEGSRLYEGIADLMLGTPGRWRMVRCGSVDCGLLWLDPRPVLEDIDKLYQEGYFTHEAQDIQRGRSGLKDRVRRAIQQRLLGYSAEAGPWMRALATCVSCVPWYRAAALRELFWLPASEVGTLLDIGCGNGQPMQRMVDAGWNAIGIDADAQAVGAARSAGLDARQGALKTHRFPDQHFDVILMSHVIEHLPDPLDELTECRRILKPSGSIVIATPNALSFGHHLSGRYWPGLDAPRHLQIFTPKALNRLAAKSNLLPVKVRTHAGIAANWLLTSQRWREAEASGKAVGLPSEATPITARWLALARVQSLGVALGVSWGDELVGRYAPVVSAGSL